MVNSIIDTDLYKFTTSYAYMKMFPNAMGTFSFIDRGNTKYTKEMVNKIKQRIQHLSSLSLTPEEKEFMIRNCYFIPKYYFDWLSSYQFDYKNECNIIHREDGTLSITVTGLLYRITLWEVPILAIVSQVLTEEQGVPDPRKCVVRTLEKVKIAEKENIFYSEFGTRRRASRDIQELVIQLLKNNDYYHLNGTSNCYFAMKYSLKPMGTHPHEWFMFHGAMYGYEHANYMALENWINVYDGDLGIALTDTYTSDVFFRNFSKKHAKLFDGIRQDSGDPFQFIEKAIKRYRELNIDPQTKTIIFSDGLDFNKAAEIRRNCFGRIKCSFGIGTNLTNDVDLIPANIVMKLSNCQMNPSQPIRQCVKLSDVEGKHTGDLNEVALALMTINK